MPFPSTVASGELITSQWGNDVVETIGNRLALAGGTMTGHITLVNADPTAANHATRKSYVDGLVASRLPLAGGNMTGLLRIINVAIPIALDRNDGATLAWRNAAGAVTYGRIVATSAFMNLGVDAPSLILSAAGSERMRVTSTEVLVGKQTSNLAASGVEMYSQDSSAAGSVRSTTTVAGLQNFYGRHGSTADANGQAFAQWVRTGGVVIGSITQNGTTGVNYNTTSDYRLKDVLGPIVGALERVRAMKLWHLAWKDGSGEFDGALAHELAEVVPDAVTGEKDALFPIDHPMEELRGQIDPQGVDWRAVVPLLAAAVQELADQVEALS